MLNFENKIKILEKNLLINTESFADSFKTDILFYFDEFSCENVKFDFLKKLNSETEIKEWINNLTSKIVLKFDENSEQLSDFIYYETLS